MFPKTHPRAGILLALDLSLAMFFFKQENNIETNKTWMFPKIGGNTQNGWWK